MNKQRLLEIRKLFEAVTEGPWHAEFIPYNGMDDPEIVSEDNRYIAQTVYDMQSASQNHNIDADTLFLANSWQIVKEFLEALENN